MRGEQTLGLVRLSAGPGKGSRVRSRWGGCSLWSLSCGAKTGAGGDGVRLRSVGACVRWLLRLASRVGASGAREEGAELGRRLLGLNGEAGCVQKEAAGLAY